MVLVPLLLTVLYYQLVERWVIGWIQVRKGPNRVGCKGVLQPIADAIKLLMKEQIIPAGASKALFLLAPIIAVAPALGVWAVVPFAPGLGDRQRGRRRSWWCSRSPRWASTAIIIAGWASNSKYAFIGAMRSAAQIVSYEIAMGFALVGALMAGAEHEPHRHRDAPGRQVRAARVVLASRSLPLFVVYFIAGLAETNRHPFDVAEGESEIVAGFHVEYSGMTFAVFFLAEYANMILVVRALEPALPRRLALAVPGRISSTAPRSRSSPLPGIWWFLAKIAFFMFVFLWVRASFPRYRYDQIMRLGWKVFIPITLVWIARGRRPDAGAASRACRRSRIVVRK